MEAKDIKQIRNTIALLSSMIDGGEQHSLVSQNEVTEALGLLTPQPNNSDKEFTTQNHFYNQPNNSGEEKLKLLEGFQSFINANRGNVRISATDIVEFLKLSSPPNTEEEEETTTPLCSYKRIQSKVCKYLVIRGTCIGCDYIREYTPQTLKEK